MRTLDRRVDVGPQTAPRASSEVIIHWIRVWLCALVKMTDAAAAPADSKPRRKKEPEVPIEELYDLSQPIPKVRGVNE